MLNLREIESKWQKEWEENKVFQPEISKKKKYFVNFPYPYVNGYMHIGHLYTLLRVEAFARYKRMQDFNVLYPQGWHATGSPIINAAQRIAENEPKQIHIMKEMGFSDSEIKKFADPKYWIKYFPPENKKDLKSAGFSIDWRREFFTTDLNPHYDKFVRWQFNKLKEKNYVIKSKFPVVWCPKDNTIVQDHSRSEGEGETPKDFIWVKFRLKESDLILMAGTTRPDALLGQTHLWIDPEATYKIVKVKNEKWVVGQEAIQKIQEQYEKPTIIGEIKANELMGKWVKGPLVDYDIYIVPARFIDAKIGSGIVYSALEDPVDLIEIQDIQNDLKKLDKYKLDLEVIKKLKPIPIISIPELGDNLGQEMINKYKIKSAKEKDKVKEAKDELNKNIYRKGTMKQNCEKYAGMSVEIAQELIKKDLIASNNAVMFYELTGKVVCRCLTPSIIKIVSDQWFIDYGNKEWKKLAHNCLDKLGLYPEKARQQFNYVIDWLKQWACTHEEGLGTKLPWDEKWVIESLSDSTIYMAYYTISHLIKEIPIDEIDDRLFDYIFLNKGKKPKIKNIETLKEEFEYWYPVDFRNSGKDLIQNHLTFFIFNHVAIFTEKHWPKGIGVNGWTVVDGQKMSKSLGNFITIRDAIKKYSADVSRFTMLNGGEELDDPNWDNSFASTLIQRLPNLHDFSIENYNKGTNNYENPEELFESQINQIIKETTEAMELTKFRTAIQKAYFDMQKVFKNYMKKVEKPNKKLINQYINTQIKLLSPFIPHITEEIWHNLGNKSFISLQSWPKYDEKKINLELEIAENLINNIIEDIKYVKNLIKIENPKEITIIISSKWKYELFAKVKELMEKTRNASEIIKELMKIDKFRQYGQEISKLIPKLIQGQPEFILSQEKELKIFNDKKEFLEKELKSKILIEIAEKSKDQKAKNSLPFKPAIVIS